MKISFLDAHLQWIPEYFVASVALRVKLLGHEFLIKGDWGSDDQVVRFQRSIHLTDCKNEEGKIPVLVELIYMLNESGSESRTIGSGVCMIFSRDESERTKMITLNSCDMEVIMARLLILISDGSSLKSNSGNVENGISITIWPAPEKMPSFMRTAGPGATHLVEEIEKNISLSLSRISCLTPYSCRQKQHDVRSREKHSVVLNDAERHINVARNEIIQENILDVSIPVVKICPKDRLVGDPSTLATKARSVSVPRQPGAIPETSSVQTEDCCQKVSGRFKVTSSHSADKTVQIGCGTHLRDQLHTSSSTIHTMTVDDILQNSAKIRNESVRVSTTDFTRGIEVSSKKKIADDAILRKSFSRSEISSRMNNRKTCLSHKRFEEVDDTSLSDENSLEKEKESNCPRVDTPIDAAPQSRSRYIFVGKENEVQRKSLQEHFSVSRSQADFSSLLKAKDACERVRDVLQKKNILLQKAEANAQSAQRCNVISTSNAKVRSPNPSPFAVVSRASPGRGRASRGDPRGFTEEALTLNRRGSPVDPPSRNLEASADTPRTPTGTLDSNRDRETQIPGSGGTCVSVQSGDTDIEELVSTLHSSLRRRPVRDRDSRQDSRNTDIALILDMQNRLKAAEKRRQIILTNAKAKAKDAATKAASKTLAIKESVLQSTKAFDKLRNSFDRQNETLEKVKSELFARKRNGRSRRTDGNPVASSGGGANSSSARGALDRRKRATSTSCQRITSSLSLPFSNLRLRSMSAGREARSDQLGQCERPYEAEEMRFFLPVSHSGYIDLSPSSSTVANHHPQSISGSLLVPGNYRRSSKSRIVTRKSTHVDAVNVLQGNVRNAKAVDLRAPHTEAPSAATEEPNLPPKTAVPDMTSYHSQNLLVTLVLDRIEAIQGLMEGASKDETQSMFEMIEKLASLVLALTAVIKTETDSLPLPSCTVKKSIPSFLNPIPFTSSLSQSGHENVESDSAFSSGSHRTALTGRCSSNGQEVVSTARLDSLGSVPSVVPQIRPWTLVAPHRKESEDSMSDECTDSDNMDVIYESPFKSIRLSSTSVSSEGSLHDSAVCIDTHGKREKAEIRLTERMLSNRCITGTLDCAPEPVGQGRRTILEPSLSASPPFVSISELGNGSGTGTGLHSGRMYSQAYASKAKAVPPSSSSYLLQDLPQPLNPHPQSGSESPESLGLPATDWLFDDWETSSLGIPNDLEHVSRAISNLQVRHCFGLLQHFLVIRSPHISTTF